MIQYCVSASFWVFTDDLILCVNFMIFSTADLGDDHNYSKNFKYLVRTLHTFNWALKKLIYKILYIRLFIEIGLNTNCKNTCITFMTVSILMKDCSLSSCFDWVVSAIYQRSGWHVLLLFGQKDISRSCGLLSTSPRIWPDASDNSAAVRSSTTVLLESR